ncbi:MAG TPA: lysophospholipid acyltransferase family protein [Planctomycetota bacterium]|nr:lysophospholipid acyltransferase family protein [Planctomycetota bacterium]
MSSLPDVPASPEDGQAPPPPCGVVARVSRIRKMSLLRFGEYAAVRSLLSVVRTLSYRASVRLGSLIGSAAWSLCGSLRRQTLDNLELAYGGQLSPVEANRIARGAFDVLGRNITEVANLAARPYHKLVVENSDAMRDAYGQGKGVVLVSAHMGCFSRLSAVPRFLGMKGASIMKKQKNRVLLEWARGFMKRALHLDVILKTDAPLEVAEYLREGRLVGFFADQRPRSGGFPGRLFGQPIMIAPGPAICARRYKAPMVVLTLNSRPDGTHVARVDPVGTKGTLQELSQRWMSVLEDRIREHPEQWMWMHRRWKGGESGSAADLDPAPEAGADLGL